MLLATKQQIPLPSCDHPKSHPAHRTSLPTKSFTATPPPRNFNHCPSYPPSKPPRTTTYFLRFNFIHPDTPKSIAPRDQATNPSTTYDHPKSHPVPQNFTSHKELHYHPAPSATSTITLRTRHRNHHAQQLIFCVSTSFTLIHLKALLLATKQQIPLPSYNHPKSHPVPQNFTSHKELHYPPFPPQLQPLPLVPAIETTTHNNLFFAFHFIHPDTPKSIAPRDQATNPSTLLRPPKKPSCPTELHFPQRASLPPRSLRNFNHCPSYPPSKPPRTTIHFLRFNFIHPDTPKSVAPRDQATNPSTILCDHPKAILSHEISLPTKSFTTTPSPQLQPLPFTHHRNHHAQQLIFCVSTSFTLIHLKALLLATRQKIPLPPATTQKAILPHRISLPAKSFTTTFPATSVIAPRTHHRNHHAANLNLAPNSRTPFQTNQAISVP